MSLLRDIFSEIITQYQFASDFVSKKILDISENNIAEYFCARILLKKNVFEIIYLKSNDKGYSRKIQNKDNLEFDNAIRYDTIKNSLFDNIIMYDNNSDFEKKITTIEKTFKLLKNDGFFIINFINRDFINEGEKDRIRFSEYKNKINSELLKIFSDVEIFSQVNLEEIETTSENITNNGSLNQMKKIFHNLRLKVFINLRLYRAYRFFFNDTIASKTKKDISEFKLENKKDFPKSYDKNDCSLFLIAVCKK